MNTHRLPEIFSKNRFEESKEDNWEGFVVPPFIHKLEIKTQSKALVIVGGRGCGKTTLLRYFCHATQFSPRRHILSTELNHILSQVGLYWRADTNFLNSFTGGEQTDHIWRAAFEHLLACELGREILRSLRSINSTPARQAALGGLDSLDFSVLQDFHADLGQSLIEIDRSLQRSRTRLSIWLNNLDTEPKPTFIPLEDFLRSLITTLQTQLPYLANTTFTIFIDEYENLRDEQQRFINGLLKHGTQPLLYNIAMKRNGWRTNKTIGSESIQEISDYRVIDLEELLSADFELFAAELLFFRLIEHAPDLQELVPIEPEQLRSIARIAERYNDQKYREHVIAAAEIMIPRVGDRAAAERILKDSTLKEKLTIRINNALVLRSPKLMAAQFIDDDYPEASVIMSALLYRPRENPDNLLTEFNILRSGVNNRLSVNEPLIGNNLFGCVNAIYLEARRNSILFSGFTTLALMSRGNVRHLLELIHRIFKAYDSAIDNRLPIVPPEVQTDAIREASESLLRLISGQGVFGPQLHALATCLGSIFREKHRNLKQSEPEINQFTLAGGEITEQLSAYLDEAEKWSIIFLSKETKMKSVGSTNFDYTFNPIFSAHFQISFRKKRSLQISATQLLKMMEGDQRTRDTLVREIGGQGKEGETGNLFAEINE
jgi:hypothetical protein